MSDELVLRRTLAVPPVRVWQAFTDPTEIEAWLWPARFATRALVDAWAGGRFRFESTPMDMAVEGEYRTVDAPRRLDFTWRWDGEEDVTLVTVLLPAADAGTELTLRHVGSGAEHDNHLKGWTDCLDRLVAHLQG